MFKACMEQCDNELLTVEAHIASLKRSLAHIATLKRSLAIPNEDIPQMGPPANERNQGIQQVMYLPSMYGEFPSYVYAPNPALPFREAFNVNDRPAAINRDKLSQKAWWKVNLTFLETKKKVLEERKLDLERKLSAHLKTAMEAPSFLGCGYTDYSFLHT